MVISYEIYQRCIYELYASYSKLRKFNACVQQSRCSIYDYYTQTPYKVFCCGLRQISAEIVNLESQLRTLLFSIREARRTIFRYMKFISL